jgi:hypothetical protein
VAAQPPPAWGQPPERPFQKTNDFKTALVVGLILAIVGGGVTLAVNFLTKERPSSDHASILIRPPVEIPGLEPEGGRAGATVSLNVSGSGWKGDNAVTIEYPMFTTSYRTRGVLVSPDGQFGTDLLTVFLDPKKHYYVRVTGRQSGHEVRGEFVPG